MPAQQRPLLQPSPPPRENGQAFGSLLERPRLLLLAIQAERAEQRHILQRKENRWISAIVRVLVPGGGWDCEKVSFFPFVSSPVDEGAALAAHDVVDGAARLTMRSRMHP